MLQKIKHWLQTKIYHACLNIEEERNYQKIKSSLNSFKHCGNNVIFADTNYRIEGAHNITIGNHVYIGRITRIDAIEKYNNQIFSPSITIGDDVTIQDFCHIGCIEEVFIGNGVMIASKVLITDHSHGDTTSESIQLSPFDRMLRSKRVSIGDNCWIGDGVSILPGVILGKNVIIGANSVVTKSFPSNVVIAGCPAKIIKKL